MILSTVKIISVAYTETGSKSYNLPRPPLPCSLTRSRIRYIPLIEFDRSISGAVLGSLSLFLKILDVA